MQGVLQDTKCQHIQTCSDCVEKQCKIRSKVEKAKKEKSIQVQLKALEISQYCTQIDELNLTISTWRSKAYAAWSKQTELEKEIALLNKILKVACNEAVYGKEYDTKEQETQTDAEPQPTSASSTSN